MRNLILAYFGYGVVRSTCKSFPMSPRIRTERSRDARFATETWKKELLPFREEARSALLIERLACIGVSPLTVHLQLLNDLSAFEVWARREDPSKYGLQGHIFYKTMYESTSDFLLS